MHIPGGEIASGAKGVVPVDFPVYREADRVVGEQVVFEVGDQFDEGGQLSLTGPCFLKIADQADSDPGSIDLSIADVASLKLLGPAVANFDLTVAGVASIADDKVVGEAVGHPAVDPVGAIVAGGVAPGNGAVVSDDPLPASRLDVDIAGGVDDRLDVLVGTWAGGAPFDRQLLADPYGVGAQSVAGFDRIDRGAVLLGESTEGVPGSNRVDDGR